MSLKAYDKLSDTEKTQLITEYYINRRLSFGDVAKELNTYANKIRRDAKKYNIDIRTKSDAQKNALQNGKHQHPTKGKQRDIDTKTKIGLSVLNAWAGLTSEELQTRKNKSKLQWEQMTQEERDNIQNSANKAVRQASKTGSKLEKFLWNKLLNDGFRVDFHKEQILSNTKLHIDMFLPTMNIAIEVDGPSHFKPVWGSDALKKNQKYDQKKNGLLLGKGIKIIRVKQTKDFSQSRGLIVYERLVEAIKEIKNNTIQTMEIGDENV
jgi:very-short-patch-repair endonuclease